MSFQIEDIVLYGPPEAPRVLPLKLGELCVITGASKRGKSQLINIIEYCLGSSDFNVAFGPIRSTVEWYALRLKAGTQQIFIARKAPAATEQTSSATYLEMGGEVAIPAKSALSATTNIDAACDVLSRVAGIVDHVHEPLPGQTRQPSSPSIRNALFYCFQQQYEIISPKTLFHRQSEGFYIPQLIQDLLPYYLGAIGDDHLLKVTRLRQLRQERRRIEQQLNEAKAIAGEGTTRALALLSEAADLGLVSVYDRKITVNQAREMLRGVLDRSVEPLETSPVSDEYHRLLQEREEQASRLRRVQEDRQAVAALLNDRKGYAAEGAEHASRLKTLGLYAQTEAHSCPLCASELPMIPSDSALRTALVVLESKLANVSQENPHLEQLAARLEEEASGLRSSLTETRTALEAIERSRQEVAAYREFAARAAHVRGRISIYLEASPSQGTALDDLAKTATMLDAEIERLDGELGNDAVEERLESIVAIINEHITIAGRELELEHSENPLRFSVKKLTVIAATPTGGIPMDKMGSGANWVGYHIAVHLALHRIFAEADRPVPRFLVLDQPSQVYFPADRDVEGKLEVGRAESTVDQDRAAVLKMFKLIKDTVDSLEGKLQVIVTEHADPKEHWFQSAVVERWREDGKALIPRSWLAGAT